MEILRKLRRSPLHIRVCCLILLVMFGASAFASLITPYDPNATDLLRNNRPPMFAGGGTANPWGTDQLGRDTLARCMYGLRISAGIAFFGLLIGGVVGILLGVVSGYYGGWADRLIMGLVDFQLSVPYTLIILMGLVLFGSGIPVLMAFIGFARWETYARVSRSVVLSLRERHFVEAAVTMNARSAHIVRQHILPNVLPVMIVLLTLSFPSVLMLESSLSFLGIGVQPPTATLGRMVGEGKNFLMTSWWVVLMPALVILVMSVIVQQLGDWMRDALDVKLEGE